ncbi:hypothetical protein [Leisingera sp. ANG-S5]|uniref:hypothetical protein n=1 Tax=Leisingera sp. ANG-S5 TaxID=1577901 RepID=UPI0012699B76|nr:hypothetical protein [Leisingera sp. ANG-S5]
MPSRKLRHSETSSSFDPKMFGGHVRQQLKKHRLIIKANEHQDFPWIVEQLEDWLDGEVVCESLEDLSVRARDMLQQMARDTLQTLYELWRREGYITKPHCIGSLAKTLIPSVETSEHFLFALQEQCLVYLHQTLYSEPFYVPPVTKPDARHKPNRKRNELPDPKQPAWAPVNRHKSKKFQITCRVEWHIKARIQAAAHMMGQSQATWIENAIKSALHDHGFSSAQNRFDDYDGQVDRFGRREARPELPEPDVSRHASVNRADKSTTVRVSKDLAKQIDRIRETQSRSQWLIDAVNLFINSGEELPTETVAPRMPRTEVIGLRFDREFFAELATIMTESGRSQSDWLRSVALWRIETLKMTR